MMANRYFRIFLFLFLLAAPFAFFQNCGGIYSTARSKNSSSTTTSSPGIAIQLTWIQPVTGQPSGYYIEQSSDGTNYVQVQQVAGTLTTATVSNLSQAKYYFKVSAFNSAAQSLSQAITVDLRTVSN